MFNPWGTGKEEALSIQRGRRLTLSMTSAMGFWRKPPDIGGEALQEICMAEIPFFSD